MEKRVMSYDLEVIKQTFSSVQGLRVTATALRNVRSMGLSRQDMVSIIQQLSRKHFVKSMTTYVDHRVWQDVYNIEYNEYCLYIKFQLDELGHFIVSFKEK